MATIPSSRNGLSSSVSSHKLSATGPGSAMPVVLDEHIIEGALRGHERLDALGELVAYFAANAAIRELEPFFEALAVRTNHCRRLEAGSGG